MTFDALRGRLSRANIPALDGIRALSVFLVILHHFGFERVPGGVGVTAFFVLSGFLITWLLLVEREQTGAVSLRAFYTRRALRIFPAFYTYWFLMLVLLPLAQLPFPWPNAISAFFFVGNYYSALNGHPTNAFSHTWSLAIEEQFYLLWPAVFLFWRNDLRRLTTLGILLLPALWIYRGVLCYGFGVSRSYVYCAFETRCDSLLVGCLLALLIRNGTGRRLWERVTASSALPLVTIAGVCSTIALGAYLEPPFHRVFGYAVNPLLLALLVVQLVALSERPMWSWLNSAPMRFLGRISYPLYLYQQFTLHPVRRVLASYPEWVQFLCGVAVTIGAAATSYYFVERPFLRLKGRFQVGAAQRMGPSVTTAGG